MDVGTLIWTTCRRRKKAVPAKLLRHLPNLASRNPVHLHLHHCGDVRGSEARSCVSPNARSARTNQCRTRRSGPEEHEAQSDLPASSKTACNTRIGSPADPRSPSSSQHPTPLSSLPQESSEACFGEDHNPRRPCPKLSLELRSPQITMHPGYGIVFSCSKDGCLQNLHNLP